VRDPAASLRPTARGAACGALRGRDADGWRRRPVLAKHKRLQQANGCERMEEEEREVSVGARLRQAREEHARSLESIATRTRIPPRILSAIERDDFDAVPSGIFLRGYLRAYALEVGLDPEAVVRKFNAQQAPADEETRHPQDRPDEAAESGTDRRLTSLFVVTGMAALLLVVFLWPRGGDGVSRPADLRFPEEPALAATDHDPVGPAPVATSARAGSTGAPAALSRGATAAGASAAAIQVALVAREPVWVGATADDERVLFRTLKADERVVITAGRRIVLRVGNAGALEIALGEEAARPLGRDGQVRTVTLRAQDGRVVLE
jgi:cytoskeleton protein RodZ